MHLKHDITGKTFGKLKVLYRYGVDNNGKNSTWLCECFCGNKVVFTKPNLKRNSMSSCGCFSKKHTKEVLTTHGLTYSNSYKIWENMKTRCLNINCSSYKNYGGRGIKICDKWSDSFEEFYKDMGVSEKGMSLERIDNEKGYFKENCIFINKNQQSKNRRCNIYTFLNEEKLNAREFWIKTGKKYSYDYTINLIKRGEQCKCYK